MTKPLDPIEKARRAAESSGAQKRLKLQEAMTGRFPMSCKDLAEATGMSAKLARAHVLMMVRDGAAFMVLGCYPKQFSVDGAVERVEHAPAPEKPRHIWESRQFKHTHRAAGTWEGAVWAPVPESSIFRMAAQ